MPTPVFPGAFGDCRWKHGFAAPVKCCLSGDEARWPHGDRPARRRNSSWIRTPANRGRTNGRIITATSVGATTGVVKQFLAFPLRSGACIHYLRRVGSSLGRSFLAEWYIFWCRRCSYHRALRTRPKGTHAATTQFWEPAARCTSGGQRPVREGGNTNRGRAEGGNEREALQSGRMVRFCAQSSACPIRYANAAPPG